MYFIFLIVSICIFVDLHFEFTFAAIVMYVCMLIYEHTSVHVSTEAYMFANETFIIHSFIPQWMFLQYWRSSLSTVCNKRHKNRL